MTAIRIRGLVERSDSPEQPLGPDVTLPDTVPLRIEFNMRETIGLAALSRDEKGIWADATLYPEASATYEKWLETGRMQELWPKLAIAVARTVVTKDDAHPMGVITAGEVVGVSLCRENVDRDLPPYEIVAET